MRAVYQIKDQKEDIRMIHLEPRMANGCNGGLSICTAHSGTTLSRTGLNVIGAPWQSCTVSLTETCVTRHQIMRDFLLRRFRAAHTRGVRPVGTSSGWYPLQSAHNRFASTGKTINFSQCSELLGVSRDNDIGVTNYKSCSTI